VLCNIDPPLEGSGSATLSSKLQLFETKSTM
jgi:hypothetical protein